MTPLALQKLRARVPGCELLVYTDLQSRTVLGSDGALRYPQEHLDALCLCAADLFDVTGHAPKGPFSHALFFGAGGGRGFFRNGADPGEALCCICALSVDVDQLVQVMNEALGAESSGHE
ncbi:MAG: hypothetical protein AAGA28_04495 [Pseudomonadota bacterium]